MDIIEDNTIFIKLGFIKQVTLTLKTSTDDFRNSFTENIGGEKTFFGLSDHNKNLHGVISGSSFKIFRHIGAGKNQSLACVQGTYIEIDGVVKVNLAVFIPMWIFVLVLSIITIITIVVIVSMTTDRTFPIPLMVIFLSFIVFFLMRIYFGFKKNVAELLKITTEEFNYWLAKDNALQADRPY